MQPQVCAGSEDAAPLRGVQVIYFSFLFLVRCPFFFWSKFLDLLFRTFESHSSAVAYRPAVARNEAASDVLFTRCCFCRFESGLMSRPFPWTMPVGGLLFVLLLGSFVLVSSMHTAVFHEHHNCRLPALFSSSLSRLFHSRATVLLPPHPITPHPLPYPNSRNNSRRRALGGRYCLVCSLVARSANSTNSNSNVMAPCLSGSGSPGGGGGAVNRQPLGYLGPGTVPRRGPSVQQHQGKAAKAAAGDGGVGVAAAGGVALLSSPVAISRLRRGGSGGGAPPQRMQLQQLHGAAHHQQRMGMMPKDGKFFRPLPRTRRGSWGGET